MANTKIILDGINSRFDVAEEKISVLEGIAIETIPTVTENKMT